MNEGLEDSAPDDSTLEGDRMFRSPDWWEDGEPRWLDEIPVGYVRGE